MGLDVHIKTSVGYLASDFLKEITVEEKSFPKRDEITGQPIEGKVVKILYTYIVTKTGNKVLVGETRNPKSNYDIKVDWDKLFSEESKKMINEIKNEKIIISDFYGDEYNTYGIFVHKEDYDDYSFDRVYFGFLIGEGESHRGKKTTSVIVNEELAQKIKSKVKEILIATFGEVSESPKIIAHNYVGY